MHESSTLYAVLDLHKENIATDIAIAIAIADASRDGEVHHVGRIGGELASLDKALRILISRGSCLLVVYEAGPCGLVIWRHLTALGIDCLRATCRD